MDFCYAHDGVSLQYLTDKPCRTEIVCFETENNVTVTVGARKGDYMGKTKRADMEGDDSRLQQAVETGMQQRKRCIEPDKNT